MVTEVLHAMPTSMRGRVSASGVPHGVDAALEAKEGALQLAVLQADALVLWVVGLVHEVAEQRGQRRHGRHKLIVRCIAGGKGGSSGERMARQAALCCKGEKDRGLSATRPLIAPGSWRQRAPPAGCRARDSRLDGVEGAHDLLNDSLLSSLVLLRGGGSAGGRGGLRLRLGRRRALLAAHVDG